MHDDIEEVLFDEARILAAIDGVAAEITRDYTGREFTVVSILKGSFVFASDLIRRIPIPLRLAFASVQSYRDETQPGGLSLEYLPAEDELAGQPLLLVDDILDTGRTLFAVREELQARGAGEVRTCVFLDKPVRRKVAFEADYRCFEVGDHFVVGYGLDHAGRYRNLPFVGSLKQAALAAGGSARVD